MKTYTDTTYGMSEGGMILSRRQLLLAGVGFGALLPMSGAVAQQADFAAGDMVLGSADAPITIIEYASMTCPHCANFHTGTWPDLKEHWIDTGKVRFIFREFPLDRPGLAAAMLARCGGEDRFFPFIDILFKQQARWSRSSDPMASLRAIGALGGVTGDTFDKCMTNADLEQLILNNRIEGHQTHKVNSTPTLIINEEKYESSHDYETLSAFLEGLG